MISKEKIKSLVWYDLIAKLKVILLDLLDSISILSNRLRNLELNSGVSEAPIDGQVYGRQDGDWVETNDFFQNLQNVLDNGNTSSNYFSLLDSGRTSIFSGLGVDLSYSGISTLLRNDGLTTTEISTNKQVGINPNNINFQTGIASISLEPHTGTGTSIFLFPDRTGTFTLATIEDIQLGIDNSRTKGTSTIELDGIQSIYTIPHGLGQEPSISFANIQSSTNFESFGISEDINNIVITYPTPPAAETLVLRWIALK